MDRGKEWRPLNGTLSLDVAERASLFDDQTRLIEMIAGNAELPDMLGELARAVERHTPNMLCSILLVDNDGKRLRHAAAPGLPESFNQVIDGIVIGPNATAAGAAAYNQEPVVTADVTTDPRWIEYRELATRHGLRGALAVPILSSDKALLGTLALYTRAAQESTPQQFRIVQHATHLAAIAIEKDRARTAQQVNHAAQEARVHAEADRSRLLEIFSLSPAMIAVLQGPDHVFTFTNPLYIRAIGDRQVLGKPVRDALPEVVEQGYIGLLDHVFSTGEPYLASEALVRLDRHGDGTLEDRYFDLAYQATRDAQGKIDGIFVHAIDVTDQRTTRKRIEALAEEQRMLASLVENSRDFIAVVTPDHDVIYLNPAGRALVGLDSEKQARSLSFLDYFPSDETDRVANAIVPTLVQEGHWDGEVRLRHFTTDTLIPTLFDAFTIRDSESGNVTFLACVARDIREQKVVELELLYQTHLMETITDNAASGLFMMDAADHLTFMNPAAEQMTGYTLDEIQHKTLHEAIHHSYPDGREYPVSECPIHQSTETLIPVQHLEETIVRKDGTFVPVVCSVAPLVRDGVRSGAVIEIRDVTEQKRVEEERLRLLRQERAARAETQLVHRVSRALTAELDLKSLMQTVTDATTTLTDAQFGALLCTIRDAHGESQTLCAASGKHSHSLEPSLRETSDTLLDPSFLSGDVIRLDDVRMDDSGNNTLPLEWQSPNAPQVVSYLAVPVVSRSGVVIGWLLFGHSEAGKFTERHENIVRGIAAQTAIAMDNARLYQEAQDAIRARDEFLSIAAHELRTPVTGVSASAQLLARSQKSGKLDDERLARLLRAIVESSERLSELTDDLLDIARLRSGRMPLHLETVDLVEIMRDVIAEARERYEGREFTLEIINEPCPAVIDTGRILQVLTNLVDNAAKYSPAGGEVRVTLQCDDDNAEVSVQDQGIGLPAAALERIFEQFGRAPNAAKREIPGMGLGLYISRQLVEMHGGRIWAESAGEDRGSTFTVTLPTRAASSPTQAGQ